MNLNRREFLAGAGALATTAPTLFAGSAGAAAAPALGASARADFPWSLKETFLNSAAYHPISVRSAQAMQEYIGYRLNGPPSDLTDVGASGRGTGGEKQAEVKRLFARLINATPEEIAFAQSTSDGESIIVAGMDLLRAGGNVVIDDLHYGSAINMYRRLEKKGLEVRLVAHRDWKIDLRDVERVVDRNTRLVSMALVSNVNGYLHDVKAISDVAHAHGAYVYADVIQAAGCVPIDVQRMGLDFCACSSYKWLMGSRGFGFLYVRRDLQGSVVQPTRFGHRQTQAFNRDANTWVDVPGAAMYETGNVSNIGAAAVHESLRYILETGVENIRRHTRPLVDRLRQEITAKGHRCITPPDADTPIIVFEVADGAALADRLRQAGIAATAGGSRLRVSPTVFNTMADIDRLLAVVARA